MHMLFPTVQSISTLFKVMDLIRSSFVDGDLDSVPKDDSGIELIGAEEFS